MKSAYTCQRCWKNLRSPARSLDPFIRAWPTIGIRNLSTRVQAEARRQNGRLLPAQQKRTLYWEQVQPREDFKRDRRNEVYLPENVELEETDLFHHYSISPSPRIRRRAAFIKSHAYCPHPSHRQTRIVASPHDPEARKESGPSAAPPAHVRFECPDCGIPCYCSEEHWADDYEMHLGLCDTMRQINEDDHDINSLRFFPEFLYPPLQFDEFLPNMSSWDTYLYTREFEAIDKERSLRQATNLLTYPVTIASVIHELSPYGIRNGLTSEGLKSLTGSSLSFSSQTFLSPSLTNVFKHSATPSTGLAMAPANQSKASALNPPLSGSSSSVPAPNPPSLAPSGISSPTSSPVQPSTSSSSALKP